jgi:hypothetical protein
MYQGCEMDQPTATLVANLNFAASDMVHVCAPERVALLTQAAACIEDFNRRILQAGRPAYASDAIVREWRRMARDVAYLADKKLAETLKGAALLIEATQVILDAQYEVVLERHQPKGRAN